MAFKIRDLLIDVLHAGVHCGPATIEPAAAGVHCGPATIEPAAAGVHCGPATIEPAAAGALCGPATIRPGAAGVHCGPATIEPLAMLTAALAAVASPSNLAALKQQLQNALAQIEEQERQQAGAGLPQTRAEAEDLENRLKAALAELAEHKKTLGS